MFFENKAIADRIYNIRKEKSATLTDFCIAIDMSVSTVSNYMTGKRPPDAKFLYAICEVFKVNINWVLTGEGSPYLDKQSHDDLTPLELRLLALTKRYDEQGIDQIVDLFEQLPMSISK